MSAALRLLRLNVRNVGVLGERSIELGPLSPGINVVSGSNECGKSSLVRALRATLFRRHGSKHDQVVSLRPYNLPRAAPAIEVDFELDGRAWHLEKRFLSGAYSRLAARDGSASFEGDDADTHVLHLLGAREPAKKGSRPDDMGVWSLLWVNQDELATLAPTDERAMGDHVRASLSTAIGSLVGDVMGGEHGVPLRRAIDAAFETYWTPKQQDRATGKLLAARKRVEDLAREVEELTRKVRDTVTLGADLQELERQLDALQQREGSLARDVEECEALVKEGAALEARRSDAEAKVLSAKAAHARAEAEFEKRCAARKSIAQLDDAIRVHAVVVGELEVAAKKLTVDAASTKQAHEGAQRECERLQQRVTDQGARLESLRARVELARREEGLARARRQEEKALENERALRSLPDEKAMAALRQLEARRSLVAEQVRRQATRVTVERPGALAEVHFVAHRGVVTLGALGSLTVEPPREGYSRARECWRETRRRLDARLEALRVESVSAARSIAARRRDHEAALAECKEKLEAAAPEGLPELLAATEKAGTARDQSAQRFKEATRLQGELTRLDQLIASLPLSDADLTKLQNLSARVQAQEELEAKSPVRVTLRPLSGVLVQFGARETPRLLTPGSQVRRPIAAPTTITVGDQLELEIDPGLLDGADDGKLARLRDELASSLTTLGLGSLEEATERARTRASYEASRAEAQRLLEQQAPKGLGALTTRMKREAQTADELKARVEDARTAAEQLAKLEAGLAAFTVTLKQFKELDELDQRTLAEEMTMRRLAGRVLAAEGALAARWADPEDLTDPLDAVIEGARVTLTPGEVSHDLDLQGLERELRAHLKVCGVETLAEAEQAHVRWASLRATIEGQRQELKSLAPRGVAVLDAELTPLRARAGDAPLDPDAIERLELALQVDRKALTQARDALVSQKARLDAEVERQQDAEQKCKRAERDLFELQAEQRAKVATLAVEERSAHDGALQDAVDKTRAALALATRVFHEASEAWAAATPDLRATDLERAKRTLDDHQRRTQSLKNGILELGAKLEVMLPEGRYDRLAEREVELDSARAELTRLEREAKALKLLRDTAEEEYAGAQRALMKPVYDEALPLLNLIRPKTTITMNHDTLALDSVQRDGVTEDFKDLSGGAREQLAVVVRVALARVFARQQRAMPLILDDVLGWTDDRRLRRMLDVLEHTARDMQVILLTCHPDRFRPLLNAATFDLDALKQRASTA